VGPPLALPLPCEPRTGTSASSMAAIGARRGHRRRNRRSPSVLFNQEATPRALTSALEDGGRAGEDVRRWPGGRGCATTAGRVRSDGSRAGQIEWVWWGPHQK
jgi:hypothetical protein